MRILFFIVLVFTASVLQAQTYDPPAGQPGSLAIHMDNPEFIEWASHCEITRGPGIIGYPDSIVVDHGDPIDATGKAGDGRVVSLGDSGVAILTFENNIKNGPGPDFAVFENAFIETFLELAFVEVSSDDVNFFRFPAVSLTLAGSQVPTFGELDATLIHNLAGKYIHTYGTPFDLEELAGQTGLDINAISSIKVIDVIGTVTDSLATFDSRGNMVNDPWPTPFNTGGFDLDAVGVIHNQLISKQESQYPQRISVFPNPANENIRITSHNNNCSKLLITTLTGQTILNTNITGTLSLSISDWPCGHYIIKIVDEKNKVFSKLILKH